MTDYILRTMALKSKFDGGKYSNQTVEIVLKIDPNYIIWNYYNMEKISFIDDILEQVGIASEFRINKPGIDKAMVVKVFNRNIDKMSDGDKIRYLIAKKEHNKKVKKSMALNALAIDRLSFSKQSLRYANQGLNHGVISAKSTFSKYIKNRND